MKIFINVLILFLISRIDLLPQGISDLIQPLHLRASETDTIPISDIYYSGSYNISILPNKNIQADFDKSTGNLIVEPSDNSEGLGLIDFQVNNSVYSIPYHSEIVQNQIFKLKLKDHPERVNLFGSFSGWNPASAARVLFARPQQATVSPIIWPKPQTALTGVSVHLARR